MRAFAAAFLLLILAAFAPAWGVVAADDQRLHPTITELKADTDVKTDTLSEDRMRLLRIDAHAIMNDGFVLVAIQNRTDKVIHLLDGAPADVPLIILVSPRFIIGIVQLDQSKPLGDAAECLAPQCIGPAPESAPEAAPTDHNTPPEAPATMAAPQEVIDAAVADAGVKLKPGYIAVAIGRTDEQGQERIMVATDATPERLHNLRIIELPKLKIAVAHLDNSAFADGEDPVAPAGEVHAEVEPAAPAPSDVP